MEESKREAAMDKLTKKLPDTFVEETKHSDEKTLRDAIVKLSKEIEDIEDMKKNDATLQSLKEQCSDLSGGYRDAKKERADRLKFIILTLEERGKL